MVRSPIHLLLAIGNVHDTTVGEAVLLGFAFFRYRQPFAPHIGLHPEVGEQDKEECAVDPDEMDEERYLVVTLLHEVVLGDVERNKYKLGL